MVVGWLDWFGVRRIEVVTRFWGLAAVLGEL